MTGTVGGTGEDPGRLPASGSDSVHYIDQVGLYSLELAPSVFPDAKIIEISTSPTGRLQYNDPEIGLAGTGLHEWVERFQREWLNDRVEGTDS